MSASRRLRLAPVVLAWTITAFLGLFFDYGRGAANDSVAQPKLTAPLYSEEAAAAVA